MGLWHGVKGVNRSGGFKVFQGRAGTRAWREQREMSCALHVSTAGDFLHLLWVLLARSLDEGTSWD